MTNISDTQTIDLVAIDKTGRFELIMIEDRKWGAATEQAGQLLAKVNTYLWYIKTGRLVADYPEAVGTAVSVRLYCAEEPTGDIRDTITEITHALGEAEVEFKVKVGLD